MKTFLTLPLLLSVALTACGERDSPPATGQESRNATPEAMAIARPDASVPDRGEQIYKQVCMACHATGVVGAPKAGDAEAWAQLLEEGQAVVTAHGWVGVRGMPARGGRADLALEDFARATAWMARSAGGDWPNPDEAMMALIREEELKRIEALRNGG